MDEEMLTNQQIVENLKLMSNTLQWLVRRLQALEQGSKTVEMTPSAPATTPQEDAQSGESISLPMSFLARGPMNGEPTMATVTFHGLSSHPTLGDVQGFLVRGNWSLVALTTWESRWPPGLTPSATQEAAEAGRHAGGSAIFLNESAGVSVEGGVMSRSSGSAQGATAETGDGSTVRLDSPLPQTPPAVLWGPYDKWGNREGVSNGTNIEPAPESAEGRWWWYSASAVPMLVYGKTPYDHQKTLVQDEVADYLNALRDYLNALEVGDAACEHEWRESMVFTALTLGVWACQHCPAYKLNELVYIPEAQRGKS